jgi:hypothetical protein
VDLEQQQPDGSHREAGDGLQYMVLDTNRVELRKARRWGTREAIDGLKEAEIIGGSATLIDEAILNASGFTPVDIDPGS